MSPDGPVSVVVPARGRAALLDLALASARAQRGVEVELIVVDDASEPSLAGVAARHDAVYVRQTRPSGPGASRNAGVARASHAYVAFLDSDDLWPDADKLRRQRQVLAARPDVCLVYCPVRRIDLSGAPLGRRPPAGPDRRLRQSRRRLLAKDVIGSFSTVMVRRAELVACGGCDPELPSREDWDLWLRLAAAGDAWRLGDVVVDYRVHGTDQISSSPADKITGTSRWLLKHLPELEADAFGRAALAWHLATLALTIEASGEAWPLPEPLARRMGPVPRAARGVWRLGKQVGLEPWLRRALGRTFLLRQL